MVESRNPQASRPEHASTSRGPLGELPLRARKQKRARLHAIDVASRLFGERGYDSTSLEDIAHEAEMSVSSILRYFGSKERLALAHHVDRLENFRAHLADESAPVLQRWRGFIVEQAASLRSFDSCRQERELIRSVPALLRPLSRIQLDQQGELSTAFSREAGVDPGGDVYGRLLAALLVAGNEAVYLQWLWADGKRDLAQMCLEVVDFAEVRLGSRDDAAEDITAMSGVDGPRTLDLRPAH